MMLNSAANRSVFPCQQMRRMPLILSPIQSENLSNPLAGRRGGIIFVLELVQKIREM
jgi:hypothetical protein